jgi:hypothetical protein
MNRKKTYTPRVYMGGLIVVSLVAISLLLVKTFAQTPVPSQTLVVSPPSQELKGNPGETITAKAKITNISNDSIPMFVTVQDFVASGDEGQVALTTNSKWSISSWTKVTPSEFNLKPGQSQEVSALITIPKTGAAGGRYGSFLFSVGTSPQGGQAALSQQIASLFLVRISGPVNEALTIKDFKAPKFLEFGPVPLSLTFSNNGNVHTKVYGLVNVTNMLGQKVQDIVVRGTNIFPGADRIVSVDLKDKYLFGQYKATAIIYYGEKNETVIGATTFFVFPVRIAAGIIIVFFVLYLLRKRLFKAFKALSGK